jgi:hypothetical protein
MRLNSALFEILIHANHAPPSATPSASDELVLSHAS